MGEALAQRQTDGGQGAWPARLGAPQPAAHEPSARRRAAATASRAHGELPDVGAVLRAVHARRSAGKKRAQCAAWPAYDRDGLERLSRQIACSPLRADRLSLDDRGRAVYALRRRWRDGTSAVVFEPLDFTVVSPIVMAAM